MTGPSHRRLPVLIVSGGGFSGLCLVRGLAESPQVRLLVADCFADTVTAPLVHRTFVVPPVREREPFVTALLDIVDHQDVALLFPSTAHELRVLADEAARFESRGCCLALSPRALLGRLMDKKSLPGLLEEWGLPCLPPVDPQRPGARFPMLGKPVDGWGSRGIIRLRSPEEAALLDPALLQGHLWQPCLESFTEVSGDLAIDHAGRVSPVVWRTRARTSSGFAVVCRGLVDGRLAGLAGRLAEGLCREGGRGLFNVQVLDTGDELFVSDLNPRVGTSSLFAGRAGVNLPLFVCAGLMPGISRRGPTPIAPDRLLMIRRLDETFVERVPEAAPKGFVFDLDDTLLDHKSWILAKLSRVWHEHSARLPARDRWLGAALRTIEEGGAPELIDRLSRTFLLGEEARLALIEAYRAAVPEGDFLYPDVVDGLEELRRRGLRLALLTDNPPATQRAKIEVTGLAPRLDAIVFSREHGEEKPSRDGFLAVARMLGLLPGELAMVGDNPHRDALGALASGYRTAYWMTRPRALMTHDGELFHSCHGELPIRRVSSFMEIILGLG